MSSLSDKIDVAIGQMTIEIEIATLRAARKDCEARKRQLEIQMHASNDSSHHQLLNAYVSNMNEQKRVTDRLLDLALQMSALG